MNEVFSINKQMLFGSLLISAELGIARVLHQQGVARRPPPLIQLDAHPPVMPWPVAEAGVIVIDLIGLDQLKCQRHPALTHPLTHQPHAHLTRFRQRAHDRHLDRVEAHLPGDIAAIGPAPLPPCGRHRHIAAFVLLAPIGPHDLRLHLDATRTDHVDLGRPLRLPGVGVVPDQRPAAIPQHLQAAAQLSVGAGVRSKEISREAIPPGRVVHATTAEAFQNPSAESH